VGGQEAERKTENGTQSNGAQTENGGGETTFFRLHKRGRIDWGHEKKGGAGRKCPRQEKTWGGNKKVSREKKKRGNLGRGGGTGEYHRAMD